MFNFGTQELILILIIALVVFGPGKLPEVGKAIGKGINEFKDAVGGGKKVAQDIKETVETPSEETTKKTFDVTTGAKNDDKHKEG